MSVSKSVWTLCLSAFALLLVAAILPIGSAIKCYQCSSVNNSACADGLPSNPTGDQLKLGVECSTASKAHVESGKQNLDFSFCRKTVQEVEGKTTIIRACGLVHGEKDCIQTSSKGGIKTISCQCSQDYCNAAGSLTVTLSFLLPFLVAALFRN